MQDSVLLILKVPESDEHGVVIKRINGRLDVTSTGKHSSINEETAEKAFLYAERESKQVVVLQVLSSDLYHWGICDNILSGQAKMRFVGYIREQILGKAADVTKMLEQKAEQHGVSIQIKRIETDDPVSAAVQEAGGGYHRVFIGKEKKKLFPLFKRTMGQHLRKHTTIPIEAG